MHLAGAARHFQQQVELQRSQVQLGAIGAAHCMLRHVNDKVRNLQDFRFRRIGATQARTNACDELLGLEWLSDVIIRAGFQAKDHINRIGLGGQHNDGHGGFTADGTANIYAVHARKHEVQQDEIRLVLLKGRHGVIAVHDRNGLEPLGLEHNGQHL